MEPNATLAVSDDDSGPWIRLWLVLPEYLNVIFLSLAMNGMYQGIEIKVECRLSVPLRL